ncbi:MAG: hypothetical protein HN402_07955 [Candidatus Scalindua sp.]|jgi:hypothetical protein|nr:hypothetical protein [Candidatus Scalindua sp.]MBT6757790.1 hypothetical protein [Candidatus Jacksonbacteria bacterium]
MSNYAKASDWIFQQIVLHGKPTAKLKVEKRMKEGGDKHVGEWCLKLIQEIAIIDN